MPEGAIGDDASSLYYSAFDAAELFDASTDDHRTHVDIATKSNALLEELSRETILARPNIRNTIPHPKFLANE